MEAIISHWILQTLAMGMTAALIPKLRITSVFGALKTVAALALLNATVWDVALFLSVPDQITTQAFVLFAVNGIIFWVLVKVIDGIEVDGFLPALVAPLVFTLVNLLIDEYGREIDWMAAYQRFAGLMGVVRDYIAGSDLATSPPQN
ncbi:MAG: phage holin family protein [Candidatus Binatia bacterium]